MKKIMLLILITFTVLLAAGCGTKNKENSNSVKVEENPSELNAKEALSSVNNAEVNLLSKSEALTLIQSVVDSMVDSGDITDTECIVTGVSEILIEDAFDKMNLQAFTAVSDSGFTGSFLIRKGVASFVRGDLNNTCVVDIDKDGKYELLDLYGWGSGIYRIDLTAYEYNNPIYFDSLTEVPNKEYFNCFIPDNGYSELNFLKVDDTTVKLVGTDIEYGIIKTEGSSFVVENMEDFPFKEWPKVYDQNILAYSGKEIPAAPPKIAISIDGLAIDYTFKATNWEGKIYNYKTKDAWKDITKKDQFIPTFKLGGIDNTDLRSVSIDFGNSIPDSIIVYDAMLDPQGNNRYTHKDVTVENVEICDNSRIEFNLSQHMDYFLSSNSRDYSKDWYRLFRVVCKWGEDECVYAFLINTGNTEILTEIPNENLLVSEGSFSELSSDWGIGLRIGSNIKTLPEQYYIVWNVLDGFVKKWSEKDLKPIDISEKQYGNPIGGEPMTFSGDENNGAVIWTPYYTFDEGYEVTIRAYIYNNPEDKSPIAYSEIILNNISGTWKEKESLPR